MASVGLPVYMHYCGGELEKISYFVKGSSCCGEDESDQEDSGCCRDEGLVIKSNFDLVLDQAPVCSPCKTELSLFYSPIPTLSYFSPGYLRLVSNTEMWPPPGIQSKIISSTVLRI